MLWIPFAARFVSLVAFSGFVFILPVRLLSAAPVTINFDDRAGMPAPIVLGNPVSSQYLVRDEYLPLGVRFESTGGPIRISANNPQSPPNIAAPTAIGPSVSFTDPITASFFVNGAKAVVDAVSVSFVVTSRSITFSAFSVNGALLGSFPNGLPTMPTSPSGVTVGPGGVVVPPTLSFPGKIHSVRIEGYYAFDNFSFDGLASVPEPSCGSHVATFAFGLACYAKRRRSHVA